MPKSLTISGSFAEIEKRSQFHERALVWGLVVLSLGCSPTAIADGERRVALRETTEQVILPTYAELTDKTSELSALLEELARAPADADLDAIRSAYLATRTPWKESEAFAFGPAVELSSSAGIDQSPVDTAKIDAELDSDVELSVAHLRTLGANKRGLHAIEYLLFPADDAERAAALLADDDAGSRRRQFTAAAASIVATNAQSLEAAWSPQGDDYAARFSQPGAPDSVSPLVQACLDTLLNETVVLSEVIANVKLGKPLGVTSGGKIEPETQESGPSGASLSDMLDNLRGIRNVYLGTRDGSVGHSLSELVHRKSPSVDLRARAALDDAEAALLAIPEPLTTALEEAPDRVTAAYDATKSLKRVLATEVLGTLGASLKFSDNDGD
jgi:predicted lipoprotein